MKRMTAIALLAAMLTIVLYGCGGNITPYGDMSVTGDSVTIEADDDSTVGAEINTDASIDVDANTDVSMESKIEMTTDIETTQTQQEKYTVDSKISEVIHDPAFSDYGRLIFPVDEWYYSGDTLEQLQLTWYNNIDPNKTVEIVMPRRRQIPPKRIPVGFSSKESLERDVPSALRAVDFLMWELCTTAFLMHWNYPKLGIMPLL